MTISFKNGHNGNKHVDETQLDRDESMWFITFLEAEVQRHKDAIVMCDYLMRFFHMVDVLTVAYGSSIAGHRMDILATTRTIEYLRIKWELK
jgi:hypothetical protein